MDALDGVCSRNSWFTMRWDEAPHQVEDWSPRFDHPRLAELYGYWSSRRPGDGLPSRADLDPADIPRLLKHVFLVDVLPEPLDFRYRLIGTDLARIAGRDVTGCRLADAVPRRIYADYFELYRAVTERRRPVRVTGGSWIPRNDYLDWEAALLPLASPEQPVSMLLGGIVFHIRKAAHPA
jgi:hypothetical protein